MFKIYKKSTYNNNADESYYLNQKAILEIAVSSNNLKISRYRDTNITQNLIQNFAPNTRDFQIILEEDRNNDPDSKIYTQPKMTFSNQSVKLALGCMNPSDETLSWQLITTLKNFEHTSFEIFSETEYVFLAFNSIVKGSEFVKEIYNAFMFTY